MMNLNEKQIIGMINEFIRKNQLGDEIVGLVRKTMDYEKFSSEINGIDNRELDGRNIKDLMKNMKKKQLMIPAHVNEKMEIIDGNHRRFVCEKLELPYYYTIINDANEDDRVTSNIAGRNWTSKNYLGDYCKRNVEDYIWMNSIITRYNIGVDIFLAIIAKLTDTKENVLKEEFLEGELKIKNRDLIHSMMDKLVDFAFLKFYKTPRFIRAFMTLALNDKYNHSVMLNAIQRNGSELVHRTIVDDYIFDLSKIYSKQTKNKIKYSKEHKTFI